LIYNSSRAIATGIRQGKEQFLLKGGGQRAGIKEVFQRREEGEDPVLFGGACVVGWEEVRRVGRDPGEYCCAVEVKDTIINIG